tara:strand:+ start:92 stop:343 length:252 start_codon:yes stop_codon:yes gene_type:complete
MQNYLIIIPFFLFSCDLLDEEADQLGICVLYELNFEYEQPLNEYDCWDNVIESACNGDWYANDSCENFCGEKNIQEDTFCEIK